MAAAPVFEFKIGSLPSLLKLREPPFLFRGESTKQLRFVERYLGRLGCSSLFHEEHYVDRDYIDEFSQFYSRSLEPYANYCQRLHFFRLPPDDLVRALAELGKLRASQEHERFVAACREFSDQQYLGFSVIKPIHGSPVGRTVLRGLDEKRGDASHRHYSSTLEYVAHLNGLPLTVRGLAFQQQDRGVSACASTALWSSLQKVRDHEPVRYVTPVEITSLATEYALPFGRPFPNEGLNIEQMALAVKAVGLSAAIYVHTDFPTTRGILHSAVLSGSAPVLIIEHARNGCHAVAVAGANIVDNPIPETIAPGLLDEASALRAVYVNDDRIGPYVRADISKHGDAVRLSLKDCVPPPERLKDEEWDIIAIFVPSHTKVRISFGLLRRIATYRIPAKLQSMRETLAGLSPGSKTDDPITVSMRIVRSSDYLDALVADGHASRVRLLVEGSSLSRYVGVISYRTEELGRFDFAVDTTGTERNLKALAIISFDDKPGGKTVLETLARAFRCVFVSA